MQLLIVDTETCGLNPPQKPASGVVEVAAIKVDMDTLRPLDEWRYLINPGCVIDPKASEIHGIYFKDVVDAPKLEEVFDIPPPTVHIGHHTAFDLKFVSHCYENLLGSLCTLQLSRKFFPNAPNHKLTTMVEYLGLEMRDAHSALDDCRMTLDLLRAIVDKSGRSLQNLISAARKPKVVQMMPFGKFKGTKISQLPRWYIEFFSDKEIDPDLRYSFDQSLKVRL